jgi:ubiquinone/menaquinone biosynthesis C-methylase UbiE
MSKNKIRRGTYADLEAEYYDPFLHPTCANFREASRIFFAECLSKCHGCLGFVCELGAGKSIMAELTLPSVRHMKGLWLLDSSLGMLKYSLMWFGSCVHPIVASAERLPFKKSQIDLVASSLGDPYNTSSSWLEAYRVSKPEAYLIFTCPAYEWCRSFRSNRARQPSVAEFETRNGYILELPSFIYSIEEQTRMLEDAGFRAIYRRCVTIGELTQTALSPKLVLDRGSGGPVVDGYLMVRS